MESSPEFGCQQKAAWEKHPHTTPQNQRQQRQEKGRRFSEKRFGLVFVKLDTMIPLTSGRSPSGFDGGSNPWCPLSATVKSTYMIEYKVI
jgi:hypothetical protein